MNDGVKASFICRQGRPLSSVQDCETEKGTERVQTHNTLMSFMTIMKQKLATGKMTQVTAASMSMQIAAFLVSL
jgi:hypothetical protein